MGDEIVELGTSIGKAQLLDVLQKLDKPFKVVIGGIKIAGITLKADVWMSVNADGTVQAAALQPEWIVKHTYIVWEGWLRELLDYLAEHAHSRAEKFGYICLRTFMIDCEHSETTSAREMLQQIGWGKDLWGRPI